MRARPNVVLAVVAAVVVVLAVIAGVLSSTRPRPTFDPTTPEGTVQQFVLAVLDADDEQAVALLDPELGCTAPLEHISRPDRVSLSVVSSRPTGDTAAVVLEVSERSGMFETWTHRETYQLKARDGGWMISGTPWPVYGCK